MRKTISKVLPEKEKRMNTALTIAGSDSCGGAGIQADIKTMTANGVYAMSAITALTAQNTTGVSDIYEVSPEFLQAQLKAIFEDITPDATAPAIAEVFSILIIIIVKLDTNVGNASTSITLNII